MIQKTLAASANMGVGLWTSICVAFCSLLGRQSQNFKRKQVRLLAMANEDLNKSFKKLGKGYVLNDYRVTWSGKLSVTVSALAINNNATEEETEIDITANNFCPKCGSKIDADMLFCGECGQKLK